MKEEKTNEKEKEKEKEEKINKPKSKQKSWWSKENRYYLLTAIGCAAVLLAVIIVAVAVSGDKTKEAGKNSVSSSVTMPDSSVDKPNEGTGGKEEEKPVGGETEGMIMPVSGVSVTNDYGFWFNKTLNSYYEHKGMDFVAEVGTEVLATLAGTVESIYKDDLLSGTEIVINHGNGLKTLYRFVKEAEGLKVGDTVAKGDVIGVVAEANGDEYKEGAHLHFEVLQNGANVDPATHLTLEEK